MILAEVSSGRSFLAISAPTNVALPGSATGVHRLDRGRAAGRRRRIEAGRAHGDDLHRVEALHRGDGVAGVDRPLEGVGRDHLGDVGDLADVELGGDARRDVLARGRRREQDVAVAAGEREHLRGDVLGEAVREHLGVGVQHLGDAADRRSRRRRRRPSRSRRSGRATAPPIWRRRGDGVEGRRANAGVVVLGDDEGLDARPCQITFASVLSLATSVATSATLTPAPRFGGSLTLSVFRCDLTSTPRSAGLKMSICFFFAFMMLGSVT